MDWYEEPQNERRAIESSCRKKMVESNWNSKEADVTRIAPRITSESKNGEGTCQRTPGEYSNALPYDDDVERWFASNDPVNSETGYPASTDVNVVHLTFTPTLEEASIADAMTSSSNAKCKLARTTRLQNQLQTFSVPTIPKLSRPKWFRRVANEAKGVENETNRRYTKNVLPPTRKVAPVDIPKGIQKPMPKKRTTLWPLRRRNQVRFQDPANTKVIGFSTDGFDASTIDSDDVTLNTLGTHELNQVADDDNSVMSDIIHTLEDVVMLQCDPISEMKPWLQETSRVLLSVQLCR